MSCFYFQKKTGKEQKALRNLWFIKASGQTGFIFIEKKINIISELHILCLSKKY